MAVDLEALSNDLDILTAFPLIEENIVATAKWFEGINPIGGVSDGVKRWSTSGYVERYQGSTSSFVPLEWSKVVFGNSFGIVNDANIGLTISLDGSNQTLLDAANGLLLRVNGTDVIKAYASGLAGVNTANPAYAWDVTGDINFTGTLYNNGSAVSLVTQTYVDAADANLQSQITTLGTTDTSLQNQINTLGTTDTSLQTQITTLTSVIAQTSANFRGEWSSATTYQQYDQVLRNGIRYYSQVSSNLNNDPASSPAQWSLFVNVFSGSVGIGTSSPQDLLHIKNSSAGSNAGLRLENDDQTWALYCRGFDSDKFKIQDIDANTSPFIIETTAPNNTLYLDSSGNVGIGTSSPEIQQWRTNSTVLTVLAGSTSDGVGTLELGSQKADSDLEQHGVITFAATSQSTGHKHLAAIEAISDGSTANQRGGRLDFRVKSDGSTSDTVAMSIREGGKVGIGTSSPSSTLHVQKDQATATSFRVQNNTANSAAQAVLRVIANGNNFSLINYPDADTSNANITRFISTATGSKFIFAPDSTDTLTVDGGNVGIGTSSPSGDLHIESDNLATTQLIMKNTATGGKEYHLNCTADSSSIGGGKFALRDVTANAYRMIIDSSGKVGIGTSSPSGKLDVNTGVMSGDVKIGNFDNVANGNNTAQFGHGTKLEFIADTNPKYSQHDPYTVAFIKAEYSGSGADTTSGDTDLVFATYDGFAGTSNGVLSEKMRIKADGNVGIGTSSPDSPLHVVGTNSGDNLVALNLTNKSTTDGTSTAIRFTNSTTENFLGGEIAVERQSDDSNDLRINLKNADSTATYPRMLTIDGSTGNVEVNNGNLVIGTSGKGIDFSATSGTGTSELLDDYEEGTWTPAYGTSATQFDLVSYDAGRGGRYTKIGNLVHIQGYIETDSITKGSASGDIRITGLPFAANGSSDFSGRAAVKLSSAYGFLDDVPCGGIIYNGEAYIALTFRNASDGSESPLQVSDLDTGSNKNILIFSATYTI